MSRRSSSRINPLVDVSSLANLRDRTPNYGANWSAGDPIPLYTVSDDEDASTSREPSTQRDNQNSKPESKQRRRTTYAAEEAMDNLCITQKEWKQAPVVQTVKDPDDEEIDVLVREQEGYAVGHWNALTASMEKRKVGYNFDYIVATQPHLRPEHLTKKGTRVLVKWTYFAVPTWVPIHDVNSKKTKDDQVQIMKTRLELMAKLAEYLRSSNPDFDQAYPHRWLPGTEDDGEYIQEERARYMNRTRAEEWRLNFEYQIDFKGATPPPPVYIENWVDEADIAKAEGGGHLKFITKLKPTAKVAEILANTNELGWLRCTECKLTCSYPREHFKEKTNCCGVLYGSTSHYATTRQLISRCVDSEKMSAGGGEVPHLTSHEIESSPVVECLDSCNCGAEMGKTKTKCLQMLVQRGRQFSLVIFRVNAQKGWGVRALSPIAEGEFVTEYVGEVMTAHECYSKSSYSFGMRFGWMENLKATNRVRNWSGGPNLMRRHKPFSVDASKMGNEARYINHSCEPNLISVVVYVERHGEFYHRIAFFARRAIEFGEELTIDYFPNASKDELSSVMFGKCRCGTASCKFENDEMDEGDGVPDEQGYASVDSFLSDDEEYERQKASLTEKREKSKRAAREREDKKRRGEEDEARREKEEMEAKRTRAGRKSLKKEDTKTLKMVKTEQEAKKEDEKKDIKQKSKVSSKFSTGRSISDMLRDPMEVILERCGGDKARADAIIAERLKSPIFASINSEPWDQKKMAAMLEAALAKKKMATKSAKAENERVAREREAEEQKATGESSKKK